MLLWNKTSHQYINFNSYYSDKDHNQIFYANFESEPGDQLVDIYQFDFTSVNWLNQYGFCPHENNYDYILLTTTIKKDDPIRALKIKYLESKYEDSVDIDVWSYDPSVDEYFIRAVLISQLDAVEILASGILNDLEDGWKELAWTWIVDSIKAKLLSFPTTLKEDEDLLKTKGPKMAPPMYSAVSFRTEMKKVLLKIATAMSEKIQITTYIYEPKRKHRHIASADIIRTINVPDYLIHPHHSPESSTIS